LARRICAELLKSLIIPVTEWILRMGLWIGATFGWEMSQSSFHSVNGNSEVSRRWNHNTIPRPNWGTGVKVETKHRGSRRMESAVCRTHMAPLTLQVHSQNSWFSMNSHSQSLRIPFPSTETQFLRKSSDCPVLFRNTLQSKRDRRRHKIWNFRVCTLEDDHADDLVYVWILREYRPICQDFKANQSKRRNKNISLFNETTFCNSWAPDNAS
jgi:hypothetical protein